MFTPGSPASCTLVVMLAMTGTLRFDTVRALGELARRLCAYHSVRVSDTERVVLVPPIGSFLVDWDAATIRLHIAAATQRDMDELVARLCEEFARGPAAISPIEWMASATVPVPFR